MGREERKEEMKVGRLEGVEKERRGKGGRKGKKGR